MPKNMERPEILKSDMKSGLVSLSKVKTVGPDIIVMEVLAVLHDFGLYKIGYN